MSAAKHDIESAGAAAESSGSKLGGLAAHLGTVAIAAAGVGALFEGKKFLGESAAAAEELAGSVGKMQRVMGGTAEDASRLKFALGETGVQSDEAIRSIDKFSKGLNGLIENEDGTTTKSNALTKQLEGMGITALDASGKQRSMNAILADTADKFKELPNGAEKTALAMQLFGKSGVDLIPFLNKGAEGIAELSKESDKLGLTLSQNTIDQTKKLTMAHRELAAANEGLKVQVGIALIPLMLESAQVMTRVAVAVNGLLVPAIQGAARVLRDIHGFIMDVFHGWGALTTVVGDAAGGHTRLLAILLPIATVIDLVTVKAHEFALTLKGELAEAITTRFLPALQNVVTILQSFSGGVIGTVITAVQLLISHWGELTKQFPLLQVAADNLRVVWQEQLQPALERVGTFIQTQLIPAIVTMGPTVLAVAASVKTLISDGLSVIIPLLEAFFGQFSKNQLLIAAGIAVGLLVTALFPLPIAITAIVAGLALLYTHWGDVTARIRDFADLVNQRFPEVGKFISQVQTFFSGLAIFVTEQFWPAVRAVIETAVSFIREHWGQLEALLRGPFEIAKAVITGVLLEIKDVLSTSFAVFGDLLAIFGDLFRGNWGKLWGDVKTLLLDAWTGIKQLITDELHAIAGILQGAWDTIKDTAAVAWDAIKAVLSEAWTLMQRGLRTGIDTILNWMGELPGQLLGALGNIGSLLYQAGIDLIQGMVNGVVSMATSLANSVTDAIGGAIEGGRKLLHLGSPSKLFFDMGVDTIQGYINGVLSMTGLVQAAMETIGVAAVSASHAWTEAWLANAGTGSAGNAGGSFGAAAGAAGGVAVDAHGNQTGRLNAIELAALNAPLVQAALALMDKAGYTGNVNQADKLSGAVDRYAQLSQAGTEATRQQTGATQSLTAAFPQLAGATTAAAAAIVATGRALGGAAVAEKTRGVGGGDSASGGGTDSGGAVGASKLRGNPISNAAMDWIGGLYLRHPTPAAPTVHAPVTINVQAADARAFQQLIPELIRMISLELQRLGQPALAGSQWLIGAGINA